MNVQDIATNAPHYIQVGIQIVGVAAMLAPFVPNPQYGAALLVARKVLDLLAFNFRNAKNAK